MNLTEKTLERLQEILKDASPEKVDRIRLLVTSNTTVSQKLKDAFIAYIDEAVAAEDKVEDKAEDKAEDKEVPADLAAALAVEGMEDYMTSIKKEVYKKGYEEGVLTTTLSTEKPVNADNDTSEQEQKDSEENSNEDNSTDENVNEDNSNKEIKEVLIDSVIKLATALRKTEINLEDVDGSQAEYKKGLNAISVDDLKQVYSDLSTDMIDAFSNTPSESLKGDTLVEDQPVSDEDNAPDNANESDAYKVIHSYIKNKD